MKVCASSICWHRDSLNEMLGKASVAGFEAVEILTFPVEIWDCHGDLRKMESRDLKRKLDDHGLTLAGLHLGAISTSTEDRRRVLTDYSKRAIEVADEIGCGIIVLGGPDRASEPFEPFLASLEELIPYMENTDVRFGLENHFMNSIQFIEDYDRIFSALDSPHIGMTLDTGHFTSAGVNPVEVAERFTEKVFHVHIKDHIGAQSVALGTGETDNFGVARVLKAAGYEGYFSQELEVADKENADRYAAEGLQYMRQLCAV